MTRPEARDRSQRRLQRGARGSCDSSAWRRRVQCVAALLVLFTAATSTWASDFSTGGTFLGLGHGARSHALGGAGVARLRDDSALYWNAANLAWLTPRVSATLMHANILPGVSDGYNTFSVAHGVGATLGEPAQRVRPRRFGYGLFISHLGFDFESGNTWGETTFLAGAGWAFTNFASLGMGLKGLRVANDFESADASGVGLDLSLTVLVTQWLSAAIVGRDVWTRVRWDTSSWETLEPVTTIGFDVRPVRGWAAVLDFVLREGATQRLAFGVEWQGFRDILSLRGGLTSLTAGETRTYPSLGVGVVYRRLKLDYGASLDHEDALETSHRVSLGVEF